MTSSIDTKSIADEDKQRAIQVLNAWSLRQHPPCKQWRDTGYFDVPGSVMRELEKDGLVESRKLTGDSPTEWRRKA
jgi:hypothetical protein